MYVRNLPATDCPHLAAVRAEYAGWAWCYSQGYVLYCRGDQRLLEHRLVAEQVYGIPDGHHVHHIDEDRSHNRAANLVVLSPGQHWDQHRRHVESNRRTVPCGQCGEPVERTPSELARRRTVYCSPACTQAAQRKAARPNRDELAQLLKSSSYSALGRRFGVSDNAVRRWAKAYDLI